MSLGYLSRRGEFPCTVECCATGWQSPISWRRYMLAVWRLRHSSAQGRDTCVWSRNSKLGLVLLNMQQDFYTMVELTFHVASLENTATIRVYARRPAVKVFEVEERRSPRHKRLTRMYIIIGAIYFTDVTHLPCFKVDHLMKYDASHLFLCCSRDMCSWLSVAVDLVDSEFKRLAV